MPVPTDVLNEEVKTLQDSNRQLADEIKRVFDRLSIEMRDSNQRNADAVRDSNQRLTDAISRVSGDFNNFRVEVAKEFGEFNQNFNNFRVEVAKEFGEVNQSLNNFRVEVAKEFGEVNQSLNNLRVEVAKEFGEVNQSLNNFRVEVAKEFGESNKKLETFKGRTEAYLSVARWAVGAITVVVLGLVAWSYSAYARAVHIEESIMSLRDHAKEQDARITRLIELQDRKPPPIPSTTP